MERNFKAVASIEEQKEIGLLVEELSKLCNERIPVIIKKRQLGNLKKFDITAIAVSLQFGCDESTFKELKSRQTDDGENQTYFG